MSFAQLLGHAEDRADGFALRVPEDWHQGRTAYGGFSAALALAAARKVGGELPPLRSAQVSFVGPLAGEVGASARLLRAGRNAVWMAAEVTGADAGASSPGLVASFVFMRRIASALTLSDCPPPAEPIAPEEARAVVSDHAPAFLKNHIEARFALPHVREPRGIPKRPDIAFWVRLREGEGLDPALGLLLIADALPPGVMPLLDARVPVSSMTWQANMLTDRPETRDGWWLLRSSADYAGNGCSSQIMRIWNADGEPVMAGMQSIALFG